MNQLLSQLIFFVVSGVFIQEVLNVRLESDRLVPIKGENLTLSCLTSSSFEIGIIFWYKSTTKNLLSKCYPKHQGYCSQNESIYHFNANKTGAYTYIDGLDRTRDGGKWTCVHKMNTINENDTKDITIYASPVSINIVQPITTKGDLGIETIILECQTANCSFPAPNIRWHYMKDGEITPFSGFSVTNITDTSRCPQQEAIYTSTLHLPRGTNFSGNIPFTTKFLCGVTHQSFGSETKYSDTSNNVTFAVQVSIVSLANSAGRTKVFYEGFTQTLKCISSPSRPVPIIKWFIQAHHQQTEQTDNITETDITDTNGLHVRTSEITLIMSRNHTDQNILCAGNIHSQPPVWSNTVKIDVLYAPNVSIQLYGSAKLNTSATLECTPHGEPPQYRFHEWIHMVGETEIRRLTGTLTGNSSTITLSNISIQDLGLYTCTVENNVTGLNGQLNQTAYIDLYIQGPPVFAETQVMFTGETNRSTMIKIPVYSKSSIKILKLIKHSDSSDIMNISETSFRMKLANFSMPFYKKKAMISGYEAILVFYNLKDTDFDNYTLHLQNALGNNSLELSLFASGRPQPVFRFYFNRLIGDKIELHFDPGFNGGHNQSFVIEYMSIIIHGSSWENTSINGLQERDRQYRLLPNGTFSVNLTKPSPGPYLYRMYSWNVKGQSPLSDNILIIIPRVAQDETNRSDQLLAAMPVIVGMGAGMAVLTIALVVVILRKRSYGSKSEGNIAPRYEGLRLVPTAMINEMPAEYDNIREDDNPYIEMHDHSAENNEINLRLESGRLILQSAENDITCNVYDSPTSSKAEVYSYVEPQEVRKERNEKAIARSKIRRVMNPVPLTNATSNITDVSGMNKAEVHSYLEVQDCTVDDREETHAKCEVGRVIVQSSMNNATCYDYESPVGSLTDHSTYEPKGASGRP